MPANTSAREAEVLLEIKNLKKSYGSHVVLDGINMTVTKGEVIAIVGPSGCGKSTFLRSINKLESADSGEIIFEPEREITGGKKGINILDPATDINKVRQKIGMVFQQFNLFPNMTVKQNIMLAPTKLKGESPQSAAENAMKLLSRVGLADKADAYPGSLSGGQQQRIAIARTLAMDPDVILFDEPTSALDPEMVGEVLEIMKELARDGMTMMVVTHEMGFARDVATRVIFINDKNIQEDKPPQEFFENAENERLKEFLSKVR